ncbi:hypothetical protein LZ30DRAFT_214275 [Colletotrichum cereale]|nr:hypothetical protein LZ30DRAFT_214275 [Colletotrichum cereale]
MSWYIVRVDGFARCCCGPSRVSSSLLFPALFCFPSMLVGICWEEEVREFCGRRRGQRETADSVGRASPPWFLQPRLFLEFKKFLQQVSIRPVPLLGFPFGGCFVRFGVCDFCLLLMSALMEGSGLQMWCSRRDDWERGFTGGGSI